jgi:hypothetical protein
MYDTSGLTSHVVADGDIVYVADGASGLHVLDIANPDSPLLAHTYTASLALGVAIAGERVFVADEAYGLTIVGVVDQARPKCVGGITTARFLASAPRKLVLFE